MRKFMTIVALLCTVILLCAGCGADRGTSPTVSTPPDTPVTLRVMAQEELSNQGINRLLEELAEAYMEEHQNVTIEIEYLPRDGTGDHAGSVPHCPDGR